MATEETTKKLIDGINACSEFKEKDLINRSDWGSVDFSTAKNDLDRIFNIVSTLKSLPVSELTENVTTQIIAELTKNIQIFNKIDSFTIDAGNPAETRNAIAAQVFQQAEAFYTVATPWIPFLAYQQGDVSKNINNLTKAITSAESIIDDAKIKIEVQQNEMDDIIDAARQASSAGGAAVFTQDFLKNATLLDKSASTWLIITAIGAATTTILAGYAYFNPDTSASISVIIQKATSKVAILGILLTATLWCGRNYKALKHQASINKHRALSLKTFQAFTKAAKDDSTKEIVLLEATHAIFANTETGYLPNTGTQDTKFKIIEPQKIQPSFKPTITDSNASNT